VGSEKACQEGATRSSAVGLLGWPTQEFLGAHGDADAVHAEKERWRRIRAQGLDPIDRFWLRRGPLLVETRAPRTS
jgi:hypothetical protein